MTDDLSERLRKRAEIRRQIPTRKSVQEGQPDRIADLLEEAADDRDRLQAKCDKQAMILRHLFPDRNEGVYFICGEGGEKDRNGLPQRIYVCPAYGCDFWETYEKSGENGQTRQGVKP
jgi:hypothetical protein